MTASTGTRRPAPRANGRHAAPTAVPPLTKPARPRKIASAERLLPNGLRVAVVRRPSVPMVEFRLRVPFLSSKSHHLARSSLLSETMLTGTSRHDRTSLAIALQELGGDLSVGVDADRLLLSGSALSHKLPDLLALVSDVLIGATYPKQEFVVERQRLIDRVTVARSQPAVIANEALGKRLAPGHPYAVSVPSVEEVADVNAGAVRTMHHDLVRPNGAILVLVGDISANRALDSVERALEHWTGEQGTRKVPPLPSPITGPLQLVDRPGAVQTSLRFGGSSVNRADERYPAYQLANLAFGGLFSSRWVENIREDKGYTYSPRSVLDHSTLGSVFLASADVATEVTAPAILETLYELGRMALLPIKQSELELVRQYAIGTSALSIATQAGLASNMIALLGAGLDLEWLTSHSERLARVTVDEIAAAAGEFLSPRNLVCVAVGDSAVVRADLDRLLDVEVVEG
jgi:predicted Zn-dependent peptidase